MFETLVKNLKNTLSLGSNAKKTMLDNESIAELLKTTPEALAAFEAEYRKHIDEQPADLFGINSRQAAAELDKSESKCPDEIIDRIVDELLAQTQILTCRNGMAPEYTHFSVPNASMIKPEMLENIPLDQRPQLTGNHMKRDITEESYKALLYNYQMYLNTNDPKKKKIFYAKHAEYPD